jgi:hypothetical protein
MALTLFTTLILLLSVTQAHALQRGCGEKSSTVCNIPLAVTDVE